MFKLLLILCVLSSAAYADKQWGYIPPSDLLPEEWFKYPGAELCGSGKLQAPINIDDRVAKYDSSLKKINIIKRDLDNKNKQIWNVSPANYKITLKPVNRAFSFVDGDNIAHNLTDFNIHWRGSETQLNGRVFAGETHIKFSRSDSRRSYLVFFFTYTNTDNAALKPIIDAIDLVYNGEQTQIDDLNLSLLFPYSVSNYYKFEGSSTSPPCVEDVTWYVASKPVIGISERQATQLQRILGEDGQRSITNMRPIQPLNNRKISKSFLSGAQSASRPY